MRREIPMRRCVLAIALSAAAIAPVTVFANPTGLAPAGTSPTGRPEPLVLRSAIAREALRLVREQTAFLTDVPAAAALQQPAPSHRNWVSRHPVWFGTIIGATAGAFIVGLAVHSEAAFVGFYGGAALGATTGWIVSNYR
jgi:hypothetical protein